jgi:hypothetical protein
MTTPTTLIDKYHNSRVRFEGYGQDLLNPAFNASEAREIIETCTEHVEKFGARCLRDWQSVPKNFFIDYWIEDQQIVCYFAFRDKHLLAVWSKPSHEYITRRIFLLHYAVDEFQLIDRDQL